LRFWQVSLPSKQCPFWTLDFLIFAATTEQRNGKATKLTHRYQHGRLGINWLSFTENLDHRSRSSHRLSRQVI
jgi:hypothetical protein